MNPQVSIVVATHNRAAMLEEHLAAILCQRGVEFEAVYVDDGSTDATPAILARHAEQHPGVVRFTRTQNQGPGPARNAGAAIATGKLIVIADDDTFPGPEWLSRLVAARVQHQADAVVYALEPESMEHPAERYLQYRNLLVTGTELRRDYVGPAFLLMDRELYLASGGFSEARLSAAEDFEFCHRLLRRGVSIVFDPSISVKHRFGADWASVERRIRATAIDGARVYRMLGMSPWKMALRALVKFVFAPFWSLKAYPLNLYGKSLRMEWLFVRERLRVCFREDSAGNG